MEASRHLEAAGSGFQVPAPEVGLGQTGDQEELRRLLQEATRLIEHTDLGQASEKLRRAGELAAGE